MNSELKTRYIKTTINDKHISGRSYVGETYKAFIKRLGK
jgi:hypothetical protein